MIVKFIPIFVLCLCLLLTGCTVSANTALPTSYPNTASAKETEASTPSNEWTSTMDIQSSGFDSSTVTCQLQYGGCESGSFPDAYSGIAGKYTAIFSVEELQSFFIDELGFEELPWHAEQFDQGYFTFHSLIIGTFSQPLQETPIGIRNAYRTDAGEIDLVIEHYLPIGCFQDPCEYVVYIELQGVSAPTDVNIEIIDEGNEAPYEEWQ